MEDTGELSVSRESLVKGGVGCNVLWRHYSLPIVESTSDDPGGRCSVYGDQIAGWVGGLPGTPYLTLQWYIGCTGRRRRWM